jgi:hypothetical protein
MPRAAKGDDDERSRNKTPQDFVGERRDEIGCLCWPDDERGHLQEAGCWVMWDRRSPVRKA